MSFFCSTRLVLRVVLFLGILLERKGIHAAETLQSYYVDKSTITVSGFSSGGAMAMQFHVAYSSEIKGAGIYAGIPFACGKGGRKAASKNCIHKPINDFVANVAKEIRELESAKEIDSSSNLSGSKVFVYHGSKDTAVTPSSGQKIKKIYKEFGAKVKTEFTFATQHGYPTNFYGAACGAISSSPTYGIYNCNYNGAYVGLNYLYNGTLAPAVSKHYPYLAGKLIQYDQEEFGGNGWTASMDSTGFIYVPSGCQDRSKKCKLHITFHGCLQHKKNLGNIYATRTGYIEVAEANDIIVLFPQITPNIFTYLISGVASGNPGACWDWWGYINADYLTKDGVQMKVVHSMMNRVATCDPAFGCK